MGVEVLCSAMGTSEVKRGSKPGKGSSGDLCLSSQSVCEEYTGFEAD